MSSKELTQRSARPLAALVIIVLCLYPVTTRAAPREATIFPDSAQVLEVSKVTLLPEEKDLMKALFILPGKADPHSLVTRLSSESRLKIEDLRYRQTVRRDDLKIGDLQRQTENLREERNSLQATLHSLESQLQFWQLQTKAKVKTIQEAAATAAVIGKNIKKISQEKLSREAELGKLDKKIKEFQDEVKHATDAKETAWEVTLLLSGPRTGETMLTYSYLMSECGWTPRYRLEAQPGARRILFGAEARIWQNSGQDWNGVDISLSTHTAPTQTANAEPPTWIIKPLADNKNGVVPQVWKTGKKNLPSGSRQLVKLGESLRPSDFVHLLKPATAPQAIIRASLNPPDAGNNIIPGKALLTLEGSVSGVDDYSLTGREKVLYFGPDPLVSATRRLALENAADATAPEGRKITRWTRRVDVLNSRTSPVRVRIEEPCPRAGDDRIMLTLKNEPEMTMGNSSTLVWTFDLEAGQKKSLVTTVTIDAPENMEISPF
jgi:hypothetical protein